MSRAFPALFDGRCSGCGSPFERGSMVFYSAEEGILLLDSCCGEDVQLPEERRATEPDVMPRGKTKKDRCNKCFQVPASNGVCGCDE